MGANSPFGVEADGDVGVGVVAPEARPDVENNDAVRSALQVTNADPDGIGLEVTDGRVVLSYGAGGAAVIPGDVVVYTVEDGTGGSSPAVSLPVSGTDGQILYVCVLDVDCATIGGNVRVAGDALVYIYAGGRMEVVQR